MATTIPDETTSTATPPPKITAMDLIMDEVRMAVKVTQHYDELIKTAKTATKKAFYHKKLKANNEYIMKALVMLERYKKVSDAADTMHEEKTANKTAKETLMDIINEESDAK
jgi:hypothetical protein